MSDAIRRSGRPPGRPALFIRLLPLLLAGCSNDAPDESVSNSHVTPLQQEAFVGSEACSSCHSEQTDAWRSSHHAKAMQHASDQTVLGAFDGRSVGYFDETAEFLTSGDEFVVRTLDADGEPRDYPVRYTFGVTPIQQYLVEFPGGRLQALPWLWDTRPEEAGGQAWLHLYPDAYVAPGSELHWTGRRQNWNYMCAECHSTNVVQGYDARTDTFETRYDEINVGCEACHGPGGEHARKALMGIREPGYGLTVDLADQRRAHWVMNPETGIAERSEPALAAPRQPEACGQCHARRGTLEEPYEHGKPLADTHQVALLDDGLYFPDGQIHEEVYVYGSFLQSRMYRAGVTCTDCHDPHSGRLVTGPDPNAVCAQCHSPEKFAADAHIGHTPAEAGCVDCHMTARTYMVVDDRRDHSFRIPRPDLTTTTGSPNACANCHAQLPAEAAANFVAGYREGQPASEFATALAAARRGHANALLVEVIRDAGFPGIARGSAAAALRSPFTDTDRQAIELALEDPDPLIRIGGLRALRGFAPQQKAPFAADLLADKVLSVRIEAAVTFANAYPALDPTARNAFNEAAAEFRRSRLMSASQSESVLSLADFEALLGNQDQAIAAYERALYVEPGFAVARTNFVDYLRSLGDEQRGEALLREGIELGGENAILHHALGLLLVRTSRPDEALQELERSLELEPANPRFAYVLGIAQSSLGFAEAGLDTLAKAHASHPADFDIAFAYASYLRDAGNLDTARTVVAAMAERYPDNRDVMQLAGTLR